MTVVMLVGGVLALVWLCALVAVLTNPDRYRNGSQLIWVLVLLLTGPVGALLYLALGPVRARPAMVDQERAARVADARRARERQRFLH